jgi:hypothetical protein
MEMYVYKRYINVMGYLNTVFIDCLLFQFPWSKNKWLKIGNEFKNLKNGNFWIIWEQSRANICRLSHPKEVERSSGIIEGQTVWFYSLHPMWTMNLFIVTLELMIAFQIWEWLKTKFYEKVFGGLNSIHPGPSQ